MNCRTCNQSAPENISVSVWIIVNHVSAPWKCSYIALQSNDDFASWFTICYLRFFFSDQFCLLKLWPGFTRNQDNRIKENKFCFLFLLWGVQEDKNKNGSNVWKINSNEVFQKSRSFLSIKNLKVIFRYGNKYARSTSVHHSDDNKNSFRTTHALQKRNTDEAEIQKQLPGMKKYRNQRKYWAIVMSTMIGCNEKSWRLEEQIEVTESKQYLKSSLRFRSLHSLSPLLLFVPTNRLPNHIVDSKAKESSLGKYKCSLVANK